MDDLISQEQSAFVKGRQIMKGPVILNEVILWCKAKKEKTILFKVDFQKAFDSGIKARRSAFSFSLYSCYGEPSYFFTTSHWQSIAGIGVISSIVHNMAAMFGCSASKLPFSYLGVNVGANMKRVSSWDVVIKKFTVKLSSWKAKTLSVGGRLTLVKFVLGAIPTYFMSLFKVPEGVLKRLWLKKKQGGLGAHSLFALDHALLFKWIWRFKSTHSGLWINVIKAIHGNAGSLNAPPPNHGGFVWLGIILAVEKLKSKDKLPTRCNLAKRGVNLPCSLCPICQMDLESRDHLFFRCSMALDLYSLFSRWWNIQFPSFHDFATWEVWLASIRLNKNQKLVLKASFSSLWWHIWIFRNAFLFSERKPLKGLIFDNFVSQIFNWVSNRCRSFNCNWVDWLKDPMTAISM
nr:hypothetical protein [Tanacetum cinerariifolium]